MCRVKVTKLLPFFSKHDLHDPDSSLLFPLCCKPNMSDEPFCGLFCQTKTYHAYSNKDAIKSYADLILTHIFTKKLIIFVNDDAILNVAEGY